MNIIRTMFCIGDDSFVITSPASIGARYSCGYNEILRLASTAGFQPLADVWERVRHHLHDGLKTISVQVDGSQLSGTLINLWVSVDKDTLFSIVGNEGREGAVTKHEVDGGLLYLENELWLFRR